MDDLTLRPEESEFEAALYEMLKMHREKNRAYATADDPLSNFKDSGNMVGLNALQAGEILMAKHSLALKNWFRQGMMVNTYSDDGFLDRAVYAVINLCLYKRYRDGIL